MVISTQLVISTLANHSAGRIESPYCYYIYTHKAGGRILSRWAIIDVSPLCACFILQEDAPTLRAITELAAYVDGKALNYR